MIRVTSIGNLRNLKENYDHTYAIVRSLKNKSTSMEQVTALSPSTQLFYDYRHLVNNNQWDKESFERIYVPRFLNDMVHSEEGIKWLNDLYRADKRNEKICLVCFCKDEELCHRSIVAGILQGVGCNVVTDTKNDYSEYYNMFQKTYEEEMKKHQSKANKTYETPNV